MKYLLFAFLGIFLVTSCSEIEEPIMDTSTPIIEIPGTYILDNDGDELDLNADGETDFVFSFYTTSTFSCGNDTCTSCPVDPTVYRSGRLSSSINTIAKHPTFPYIYQYAVGDTVTFSSTPSDTNKRFPEFGKADFISNAGTYYVVAKVADASGIKQLTYFSFEVIIIGTQLQSITVSNIHMRTDGGSEIVLE